MLIYKDHGKILGIPYKIEVFGDQSIKLRQNLNLSLSKSLQKPFNLFFQLAEKLEIEHLNRNESVDIKLEGDAHFFYFFLKKISWYFDLTNVTFDSTLEKKIVTQETDFFISKMTDFVDLCIKNESLEYSYLFCKKCFSPRTFSAIENNLGVDFVIPVRNTPSDQLLACLESLEGQIESFDKVFIVDDNDFPSLSQELFAQFSFQVLIIRGMVKGIGSARNIGAIQGNNPLVLFIDSDDYVLPEFVSKQRIYHGKNSAIGGTGTWLQSFGSNSRIFPQWDNISPLSILSCLPPAGILMWKREALKKLNFFDSEYQIGFEDFDLVARATVNSIPIRVLDEILYKYRRGHNSLSQSWSYSEERELRNRVNFNLKYICDHDFDDFLDLNSSFGLAVFQSNPDFLFIKEKENRISFIQFLFLLFYILPKKLRIFLLNRIEKKAPFLVKYFPRIILTSAMFMALKRNRVIQKIWDYLPNKLKLFLFRKYFRKIK
jgi:GT2 family glycosyltransferase